MRRIGITSLLALLAVAALAAGCQGDPDEAGDLARLQAMEAEIDDLIGDAACQGAGDCRAVAFGAKPCGGPWTYKVFAASQVDTVELLRLVAAYNKHNELLNERWGWMSDCMHVSEPGVDCLDGHCRAVGLP